MLRHVQDPDLARSAPPGAPSTPVPSAPSALCALGLSELFWLRQPASPPLLVALGELLILQRTLRVRFCNLIDWSLYGRDFVHTCLWHSPLNSTRCLFVYGCAVQVLLTVQYTRTHIM